MGHEDAPPAIQRPLVRLWRCSNRYHHLNAWGAWVACANLQPRPGGECWECRRPDGEPWANFAKGLKRPVEE